MEQDAPLGRRLLAEAALEDKQTPAVDAAVSAATAAAALVEAWADTRPLFGST